MLAQTQNRETYLAAQNRRRMMIAFVLLLAAVVVLLVRDHTSWLGGDEVSSTNDEVSSTNNDARSYAPPAPQPIIAETVPVTTLAAAPKRQALAKASEGGPSMVVTERAALPPLNVEVVAGNGSHHPISPAASALKVDLQSDAVSGSTVAQAAAPRGLQRASLSLDKTITYPLLASQTNVQGAVLLQALIGADGSIRDLHVISGPDILSSAARVAALQWRFRPYLQDGKAVESEARITVHFVIKVSEDKAREDAHKGNPLEAKSQPADPGN